MQKQSCREEKREIKKGLLNGLISGVIPHIGCLVFILITIFGISAGSVFLKKFILASWSFPLLIILSFLFASVSSIIYFKRNCCENKTKYISILLGSVLFVNIFVFYVVFPWVANTNNISKEDLSKLSHFSLKVNVPCSGHAPLIIDELKWNGVSGVKYKEPDIFEVFYDENKISKDVVLGIPVLKDFKAVEI